MNIERIPQGRSTIGISLKLSSFFEDMEYTSPSVIDTSLDLNTKPFRVFDDDKKQEGASHFIEFVKEIPVKQEEASALQEELNRVGAENKKLTEMLTVVCENYNTLRNQVMEYMNKNGETDSNGSRKRKATESITNNNNNHSGNRDGAVGASESSSSDEDSCKKPKEEHIKPKISKAYVQTEASDTSLITKDGYQWRKYGQKVTRDNPYPRAYFKCALAPSCPVKKKVQRSVDDQTILVATYEGEHNHPHHSKIEAAPSIAAATRCVTTLGSSAAPTISIDLTKSNMNGDEGNVSSRRIDSPELQKSLVEQMASSLTKDPNFRAALAAAISGRIMRPN